MTLATIIKQEHKIKTNFDDMFTPKFEFKKILSDQLPELHLGMKGSIGLLISNVFSNSIGAADAMLNGNTTAKLKDFIRSTFGRKLTEAQLDSMMICICLGYGLLSIGFIYFNNNLDGLLQNFFQQYLQTFFSIIICTGSVGFGALLFGAFFPWADYKSVIGGTISSIAYMAWVTYNQADSYEQPDLQRYLSADQCFINETLMIPIASIGESYLAYKATNSWYTGMIMIIYIITGIIIRGLTGFQDPKELDQNLLPSSAKWTFNHLPSTLISALNLPYYDMVEREHEEEKKEANDLQNITDGACNANAEK